MKNLGPARLVRMPHQEFTIGDRVLSSETLINNGEIEYVGTVTAVNLVLNKNNKSLEQEMCIYVQWDDFPIWPYSYHPDWLCLVLPLKG